MLKFAWRSPMNRWTKPVDLSKVQSDITPMQYLEKMHEKNPDNENIKTMLSDFREIMKNIDSKVFNARLESTLKYQPEYLIREINEEKSKIPKPDPKS